mmetsp:Transcript_3784/g.9466  ORF Transcript_3784/g.9466 Transcript_3784/m.9466 type:complete len:265 (+) Transcript_3784:126-920(+)
MFQPVTLAQASPVQSQMSGELITSIWPAELVFSQGHAPSHPTVPCYMAPAKCDALRPGLWPNSLGLFDMLSQPALQDGLRAVPVDLDTRPARLNDALQRRDVLPLALAAVADGVTHARGPPALGVAGHREADEGLLVSQLVVVQQVKGLRAPALARAQARRVLREEHREVRLGAHHPHGQVGRLEAGPHLHVLVPLEQREHAQAAAARDAAQRMAIQVAHAVKHVGHRLARDHQVDQLLRAVAVCAHERAVGLVHVAAHARHAS